MHSFKNKTQQEIIGELRTAHKDNKAFERFHSVGKGPYLRDMVYGANDGIVTTFAVVAGVAGASLDVKVVLILGLANLFADGLSMATGNFIGVHSENQLLAKERQMEEYEVEYVPEEERKEIEKIYRKKGFTGDNLKHVVDVITSNKKLWVDEMMIGELGVVPGEQDNPFKTGLTTLVSFVVAGSLPLVPYLFGMGNGFRIAIIMTGVALFIVGSLRTLLTRQFWIVAGLEMLGIGALAAASAYMIGYWIESLV